MSEVSVESKPLIDAFGRQVTYLRLSVTDRCDLRCTYCMAERMKFLPKSEILTLEELETIAREFVDRGVEKIRLTGGEPLVRPGIDGLIERLGSLLGNGLSELTLTTNATQLKKYARSLYASGVRRINVSLDSLNAETFRKVTRIGDLHTVLEGIDHALKAGLHVKINTVALKNANLNEIPGMIEWAHSKGMDLTLIEVMPLGETGESRLDQYVPLPKVRDQLEEIWTLSDVTSTVQNGGPSKYVRIRETGGRLGFITPLTNNFCAGCNRVRVTCTGRIYMCLGQEDHIDLREALRQSGKIASEINKAMGLKPEKHEFSISNKGVFSQANRHMSMTGG